ncbi:MAG: ABC transporter permease [Planctomycetota bacterium]
MLDLAWANLTHHKLRTALCALAVGIGIMLMLVSRGLATGSIAEVDQRMQSVDAELVILPAQDNIIFTSGAPFRAGHERYLRAAADADGPLAADVIPVFFGQVRMGGQQQRLFGVDPRQMAAFLGARRVRAGRLFGGGDYPSAGVSPPPQPPPDRGGSPGTLPQPLPGREEGYKGGLELVIDERLQRVGDYHLGDPVQIMGQTFHIVGVVEAGVAGRVFAPLATLREIVVAGEPHASMYFVKLRPGLDPVKAADTLAAGLGGDVRVELKSDYGRLLRESFASVNLYMSASSGVALVACFLFILLTMYTNVIQRTREIGILKALGVGRLGLVRLAVSEALLISLAGVAIGIGLAVAAKWGLASVRPLLTVDISTGPILAAVAVGVIGGTCSALYPGYRAARLDPALALSHE